MRFSAHRKAANSGCTVSRVMWCFIACLLFVYAFLILPSALQMVHSSQESLGVYGSISTSTKRENDNASPSPRAVGEAVRVSAEKRSYITFSVYVESPDVGADGSPSMPAFLADGAVHNVHLARVVYPGWICRFYVDDKFKAHALFADLQRAGAEVFFMRFRTGAAARAWRFLVMDDDSVDRFIVRDVDSRITWRERYAVDEWIRSGAPLHVMRDSAGHFFQPIYAGMWGAIGRFRQHCSQKEAKGNAFNTPATELLEGLHGSSHVFSADQDFLTEHVWKRFASWALVHQRDLHTNITHPRSMLTLEQLCPPARYIPEASVCVDFPIAWGDIPNDVRPHVHFVGYPFKRNSENISFDCTEKPKPVCLMVSNADAQRELEALQQKPPTQTGKLLIPLPSAPPLQSTPKPQRHRLPQKRTSSKPKESQKAHAFRPNTAPQPQLATARKRCYLTFSVYVKEDQKPAESKTNDRWGLPHFMGSGIVHNVYLARIVYPGWICRFYVSHKLKLHPLWPKLREVGAEVVFVPSDGGAAGRAWRFMIIDDPSVERFVVRDIDGRPTWRERVAVDEWIRSGEPLHVMRDGNAHFFQPIYSGMWGAIGRMRHRHEEIFGSTKAPSKLLALSMEELINTKLSSGGRSFHTADQAFLTTYLWDDFKTASIVHNRGTPPKGYAQKFEYCPSHHKTQRSVCREFPFTWGAIDKIANYVGLAYKVGQGDKTFNCTTRPTFVCKLIVADAEAELREMRNNLELNPLHMSNTPGPFDWVTEGDAQVGADPMSAPMQKAHGSSHGQKAQKAQSRPQARARSTRTRRSKTTRRRQGHTRAAKKV